MEGLRFEGQFTRMVTMNGGSRGLSAVNRAVIPSAITNSHGATPTPIGAKTGRGLQYKYWHANTSLSAPKNFSGNGAPERQYETPEKLREYAKRYYWDHRDACLARQKAWRDAAKEPRIATPNKTEYIAHFKAVTPCADCRGSFNPWQMDFDHRDRAEKKFDISKYRGKSFSDLVAEIAKCDLVCANCHRDRTHKTKAWLPHVALRVA